AIDAHHVGALGSRGGDGHAGAAPDLQEAVARPEAEQAHGPAAALHVGGPVAHDPAHDMSRRPAGLAELADELRCDAHGAEPTTSSTLEVKCYPSGTLRSAPAWRPRPCATPPSWAWCAPPPAPAASA